MSGKTNWKQKPLRNRKFKNIGIKHQLRIIKYKAYRKANGFL